ncbi:MAG: hypothetical protein MJ252_06810 [archaeon]|nr:hypothetical protein [archaeon]
MGCGGSKATKENNAGAGEGEAGSERGDENAGFKITEKEIKAFFQFALDLDDDVTN